jgi:enamine deaminase RidA (YjgF/YER057c/UK114 family)
MSTPEERLAELGLVLPPAAKPLASYVPAVRTGNYVYTSGQLPTVDGELVELGKVGTGADAPVSPEAARVAARVCALNALAAVRAVVGDLSQVVRVVKVVGYVASMPNFTGQSGVVNGASDLLADVFGGGLDGPGVHARSSVGVASLPLDAPVEIELVVEVTAR